jgi:tRNA(fMet)-specific endonuclease VapC
MVKVMLDTSILIEFNRTGGGVYEQILLHAQDNKLEILTSSIVVFEYWVGRSMNDPQVQIVAEKLFQDVQIISLDSRIAKIAGEIERKSYSHGNDALIAATAIEHNARLATLNAKHFKNIPGLKIWKPKKK